MVLPPPPPLLLLLLPLSAQAIDNGLAVTPPMGCTSVCLSWAHLDDCAAPGCWLLAPLLLPGYWHCCHGPRKLHAVSFASRW